MTTLRRSASPLRSRSRRLLPVVAVGAAGVVLALVFAAYLRPEFAFDLASRFIQCF
jgi:multisubunit Na+/H+ antiporter MnhB subunit